MKKNLQKEILCPVDYAFRRIGGKYKGRIIWYIQLRGGMLRYGELKKMIGYISPKMLTQTLRELEDDNLLVRKVFPEVPPRVEYSLTDTASELIPFIDHLALWGEKQMSKGIAI